MIAANNAEKIKTHHNAGLLDLVHLGNLLGHFGLRNVGLSGVDDVDALEKKT